MNEQTAFVLQPSKRELPGKAAVQSRLQELSQLEDGWLNGYGKALSKSGLNWLVNALEKYYDFKLPLPYLFPTLEGNILCEWTIYTVDITLSINIDNGSALYNALNTANDDMDEQVFDLSKSTDWERLNQKLVSVSTNL